jgi:hypothetical protein
MASAERARPRRPADRREVTHAEVHIDETAARIASALRARAVTAGNHIYFGPGQFAPHMADGARLLRHELAHVAQQRGGTTAGAVVGTPGDEFERAADRFAALPRGRPAVARPDVAPAPRVQRQPITLTDLRIPHDPNDLVTQLRAAVDFRRRRQRAAYAPLGLGVLTLLLDEAPAHDVLDVLRMGSRDEWITAARSFEAATHETLLGALRSVLTEREMGAAMPHLRGVVPTVELIQVWSGVFSSDLPGVIRAIQRMPDDEALPLLAEFRANSTASRDAYVNAIQGIFGAGKQYEAFRAFAARIERLAALPEPTVTPEDRTAAHELASWITVYAAFVRIEQADDERRPDWAYLAVAGLTLPQRQDLWTQYVADWRSRNLAGRPRAVLNAFLTQYYDDVQLVLTAVDAATEETRGTGHAADEPGRQIAAEALGRALSDLHAQASNAALSEAQRLRAGEQLNGIAADQSQVDRILALPDGERMATQFLGLRPSDVARRRVLTATSGSDVIAALRGLAPVDVDLVLSRPEVQQHVHDAQIDVEGDVRRILGAYAQLQGAQPETPPGTFVLTLPGPVTTLPVESFVDPLVTVAAYEAHRAAAAHDLAGVVAALRNLRPWQREQLQDDRYFLATRELLQHDTDAARSIEQILRDPHRSMSDATAVLLSAGLAGEPGEEFDIRDERLLTEALAVAADQRRLLRYHYVLEQLSGEDVAASDERGLGPGVGTSWLTSTFDLQLPQELESRYSEFQYRLGRLDPTPRLRMEDVYLGEPEITRADMTSDEMTLEAEFMRLRVMRQLEALDRGVDVSGVFGFSPETLAELRETFRQRWTQLSAGGWTRESLAMLAAAYYDVLDAIERNRHERNAAAEFIGNLAATVAGIVVIVATAGTATPFVVGMLAGAALGGAASGVLASAFRDYTSPDQALSDIGHGAVTGALTVAGEVLAKPVAAVASARMAAFAARSAVNRAVAGAATMAVEGAINGAVSGAGEAVFATAIDRHTWEHGVAAIFARFLSAAVEGAFVGGAMGAVAAPVLGGAVVGAGRLAGGLRRFVEGIGMREVPAAAVEGLEHVVAAADAGRFDVALNLLDEAGAYLSAADRELVTTHLYRRALASGAHGADITPDMVRRLEEVRARIREVTTPAPGDTAPRTVGLAPIEEALSQLEGQFGAAELAQVRRIIYAEVRLPTAERLVRQAEFEGGMRDALTDLLTPQERVALPAYDVRVLSPESFSGMFRTTEGRAVTLVEGGRPVVYVRSDAPVRTYMLQEAAHLRQLADPHFAADVRLLSERNVSGWAATSAEDRMNLLGVQRRLEIDAQERILATLQRDAPYAEAGVAGDEIDNATRRLEELRRHETEAARITPQELSEMNAGVRPLPPWMDEEARLFGREVIETRPAAPTAELRRTAVRVRDSTGLEPGQSAYQVGNRWTKQTIFTSDVSGRVEDITVSGRRTIVRVRPDAGGELRTYVIEGTRDRAAQLDVAPNQPVARGDRLGSETRNYRLVEVREGRRAVGLYEEIEDVNGHWVERGSARSTRGEILEQAAQLQEEYRLRRATGTRPGQLRSWLRVEFPPQRRGFDRAFVEFSREGNQTVARIRALEVKDYPNSYVPYAEFTAITDNLDANLRQLRDILQARATELLSQGQPELASALTAALEENNITIEVWLGPDTLMGSSEADRSVLARLRQDIADHGGARMDPEPRRVRPGWRSRAAAAHRAAATTGGAP